MAQGLRRTLILGLAPDVARVLEQHLLEIIGDVPLDDDIIRAVLHSFVNTMGFQAKRERWG